MEIFKDYKNTIRAAMEADLKRKRMFSNIPNQSLNESISKGMDHVGLNRSDILALSHKKEILSSLNVLAEELGVTVDFNQPTGAHPDFVQLKGTNNIEYHYITSIFIDVKGSTSLFAKYSPDVVSIIVNTIQQAGIHLTLLFGGYVHRLQGDGLFAYFGGKNVSKNTSVLKALQATSLFTYFIKNDLKELFLKQGIDKIFTRIGIDLGEDEDVAWFDAGIGEISEVTTSSLHTSLAPKMQSHAESNGIVVGDNVKGYAEYSDQLLMAPVSKRTGDENNQYIFQNQSAGINYAQYDFEWLKFLKRQSFIITDTSGEKLEIKGKPDYSTDNLSSLGAIASKNKPFYPSA